jgi:catechol 2,3-dioxygenase
MAFSSGRAYRELLLIEVGEDVPHPGMGRRAGLYHFGLKVGDSDEELREAFAAVEDADVRVVGASDHTVTHGLYILDPDEPYIDVPGVDWSDPNAILSPVKPLRLLQ